MTTEHEQPPRDPATGRFTREPSLNDQIRFAARHGWQNVGALFGPEAATERDGEGGQASHDVPHMGEEHAIGQGEAASGGFDGGKGQTPSNAVPPAEPSMSDLIRQEAGALRR